MSSIPRISKDQHGILLAHAWALRSTCAKYPSGCVLMDSMGRQIGSGYSGAPRGLPHCTPENCVIECNRIVPALENALMSCQEVYSIDRCYITSFPSLHAVAMLLNTSCQTIVFSDDPNSDGGRRIWNSNGRSVMHIPQTALDAIVNKLSPIPLFSHSHEPAPMFQKVDEDALAGAFDPEVSRTLR